MKTSVLGALFVITSLTGCAQLSEAQRQRRTQEAASQDTGRFVYSGYYFLRMPQTESARQPPAP
jgi:hypothetical protein